MQSLRELVAEEVGRPVDPRVSVMAAAIANRHAPASRAVLFYGSCLREKRLEGLMLDFYLVVSDYRTAYDKIWLAIANRLIPPNVFYFEDDGMVSKYAVLSEADFRRLSGPDSRSVSVWARFAQPSRIVWSSDDGAHARTVESISKAAPTLLAAAGRHEGEEPLAWWRRAFRMTYSAELRAERQGRIGSVVDADPERYWRFTVPAQSEAPSRVKGSWFSRRVEGKILSVLRLAKASATFTGGADYIVWKINRHSGADIHLKPWQRRWPLLGAVSLLPRLLRSGAIR